MYHTNFLHFNVHPLDLHKIGEAIHYNAPTIPHLQPLKPVHIEPLKLPKLKPLRISSEENRKIANTFKDIGRGTLNGISETEDKVFGGFTKQLKGIAPDLIIPAVIIGGLGVVYFMSKKT